MTLENFSILLFILGIITSTLTDSVKKVLDSLKVTYASNVVVLCVSVVVAGVGSIIFYIWNDYAWTSMNIICIFMLICANWLVSMLGYDKVMQTIKQVVVVVKSGKV